MQEGYSRQKLIEERINKTKDAAVMSLKLIRQMVMDFLINQKGYHAEDIESDREFEIIMDDRKTSTSADYIIRLNAKRLIVIKCSPGALESRDRHLISFARVVDSHQIPFAVVTDGSHARLLDAVSGKLISEGLDSIPNRSEALKALNSIEFIPYPAERMEREKRILLAFDTIKCTEEACE